MTRDDVIKGLTIHLTPNSRCKGCPYLWKSVCIDQLLNDALALLKEEPKRGRWVNVTNGRGGHECSLCHDYAPSYKAGSEYLANFCPNCGARMEEDHDD